MTKYLIRFQRKTESRPRSKYLDTSIPNLSLLDHFRNGQKHELTFIFYTILDTHF